MSAIFKYGYPIMVSTWTATTDVTAGDVISENSIDYVAHADFANGELTALAAGGGVYDMVAGGAISAGSKVVYSAGKVTAWSTGASFGRAAAGSSAAADNDPIVVIHEPASA